MAGALPSNMVKNPKLNVNSTSLPKEDEREEKGNLENTNTVECKEEQRDTPQPELKDPTDIGKIVTSRNDEEREIKWLDIEEPLDLVDTSEESVYESLIKEMPKCSLNYDFRIKKDDPRNLKVPCMIGHKFMANAYIDVDLPMNIMSLTYYNSIRKSGYEYRGRNFKGLGRDMHVFVGNMSYVMDFTILENIETNIDPSMSYVVFGRPFVEIACLAINRKHGLMTFMDGTKEITFKTPYKDPERNELSSEGHDLLSSRIILSEDDYDRGCRKPSDLEDRLYRDTIKLAPEYVTGITDEGEVSDSLLLIPLCCDDIQDVTPRVSALAGFMSPPAHASRAKFHWGIAFATGHKRFTDLETKLRMKHTNRVQIPKGLYPRRIVENLTKKQVGGKWTLVKEMLTISKDGEIFEFHEYHSSGEEEPTKQPRALNKYGFVDHPKLQMNEFDPHRLPQREGNMNGWLIEDEDELLEHEASEKGVDLDLESTASSKPMLKKTTKANLDRASRNCLYCSK
ncbi:hypothetical protein Tco_0893130 [Tanacetum coccineum]|uniref:Uncharacterized protein n=1 Tax=Tanacetum coccineum TaxID=301880 RepID=A0ABQ5CAU9_9ASTR